MSEGAGAGGSDSSPAAGRASAIGGAPAIGGSPAAVGGSSSTPVSDLPTLVAAGALTELSTAPRFPVSIAAYGGNLYFVDWGSFSNDGAVYGLRVNGEQMFRFEGLQGPGGIAANANGVFWAAASDLSHADLDGANRAKLSTVFINDPIALGPHGLYGMGSIANTGAVLGLGFGQEGPVSLTSDADDSYGLAADADNVYWSTFSDPMSIRSVPVAGGEPTTLATSPGPGGAIALDAHSVYWVAKGAVMKVPRQGGAANQLASDTAPGFISGIAVYDSNVYWSTADSILKVPVDGGTPEVLVTGLDVPSAIAVDGTSLYFATVGNPTGNRGAIYRFTPK